MSSWLGHTRRRSTSSSPNTIRPGRLAANTISEHSPTKGVFATVDFNDPKSPHPVSRAASYLDGTSSSRAKESMALTASGGKQRATLPKKDEEAKKPKMNETTGTKHSRQDSGLVVSHGDLSAHFTQVNELLAKHTEHMEIIASMQAESEQRVSLALENVSGRRSSEFMDLSHLWTYLDRIQGTMERFVAEKSDAKVERVLSDEDLMCVLSKLDALQVAVEENTAVVKELLEEKKTAAVTEELAGENGPTVVEVVEPDSEVDVTSPTEKSMQAVFEKIVMQLFAEDTRKPGNPQIPAAIPTQSKQKKPLKLPSPDNSPSTTQLESNLNPSPPTTPSTAKSTRKVHLPDSDLEKKLDALAAQVQAVVAAQTGMAASMRRLAERPAGQMIVKCEHKILPAPRKLGRRVVGYVYDC